MLLVGEEVVRLEGIAAELRRARPGIEQVAIEVERVVRESDSRIQQLAEIELHLRAARDPELRDASRRCFVAYEEVAEAALAALQVPDAERHARSIVALMYGLSLRRLGTGGRRRHRPRRGAADDGPRSPGRRRIASSGDPRDRPGNDRNHLPRVRRGGPDRRPGVLGVRAALPAPGLGRARRDRDLGDDAAGGAGGDRRRRRRRRRARRRSGSPTSARPSSPGTRDSGEPIHRALVWQDRRTADRCAELRAEGREALVRERTGLVLDPYFSGDEDRVAAAKRRRGRARGVRHDRLLAPVQADRDATPPTAPTPRGRCCSTSAATPGTRISARCSASTPSACRSRCPRRTSSGRPPSSGARSRSRASPVTSRRRCSARPAIPPGPRRTPTGPAASSSSTPGPRPPTRSTAC